MSESIDVSSLDENLERLRRKVDAQIERLLSTQEMPAVETSEIMTSPLTLTDVQQAVIAMPAAAPIADARPGEPGHPSTPPSRDVRSEPRSNYQRPNDSPKDWQEPQPAEAAPSIPPVASHPGFFTRFRAR